jgi:methanogenic corrinoid protein MtbC1
MTDKKKMQEELINLLLGGDSEAPVEWARKVLDEGLSPVDFFNDIFTPSMTAIGDKFGRMDIFLPELIDSAERAQAISDQVVQPMLTEQGSDQKMVKGKVLMCSVQGDLHDIGKNMVVLMLKVNGFEVVDLGVDVPVNVVLERAKEEAPDIVGLSSLMTTSQPYMKEVVERRDGFGLKGDFDVIVGGAPITAEYAANIGADAYGKDAVDAVTQCQKLLDKRA